MSINGIGGSGTTTSTTQTSQSGINGLNQNDFLQLLVAQMQNQDPTNPVSSDQFLQEMASFTEVVDISQLQTLTQSLLSNEVATQGLGLLGKQVTAQTTAGAQVTGTVTELTMVQGQPMLTINGTQLPVSQVVSVQS